MLRSITVTAVIVLVIVLAILTWTSVLRPLLGSAIFWTTAVITTAVVALLHFLQGWAIPADISPPSIPLPPVSQHEPLQLVYDHPPSIVDPTQWVTRATYDRECDRRYKSADRNKQLKQDKDRLITELAEAREFVTQVNQREWIERSSFDKLCKDLDHVTTSYKICQTNLECLQQESSSTAQLQERWRYDGLVNAKVQLTESLEREKAQNEKLRDTVNRLNVELDDACKKIAPRNREKWIELSSFTQTRKELAYLHEVHNRSRNDINHLRSQLSDCSCRPNDPKQSNEQLDPGLRTHHQRICKQLYRFQDLYDDLQSKNILLQQDHNHLLVNIARYSLDFRFIARLWKTPMDTGKLLDVDPHKISHYDATAGKDITTEFHRVIDVSESDQLVYESLRSAVTCVLSGVNATVIMDGYDHTGKSETLHASSSSGCSTNSILSLAAEDILGKRERRNVVRYSVIGIYGGCVYDLLTSERRSIGELSEAGAEVVVTPSHLQDGVAAAWLRRGVGLDVVDGKEPRGHFICSIRLEREGTVLTLVDQASVEVEAEGGLNADGAVVRKDRHRLRSVLSDLYNKRPTSFAESKLTSFLAPVLSQKAGQITLVSTMSHLQLDYEAVKDTTEFVKAIQTTPLRAGRLWVLEPAPGLLGLCDWKHANAF